MYWKHLLIRPFAVILGTYLLATIFAAFVISNAAISAQGGGINALGSSDDPDVYLTYHNRIYDTPPYYDTFVLLGNNLESAEKRCKVTVTITKKDGDTKDFTYEFTMPPNTSSKEYAKETGYGPIEAKITSKGCQQ